MNQGGGLSILGAVKPHLAASAGGFGRTGRMPVALPDEGRSKVPTVGAFPELTPVKGIAYNSGCDPVDYGRR